VSTSSHENHDIKIRVKRIIVLSKRLKPQLLDATVETSQHSIKPHLHTYPRPTPTPLLPSLPDCFKSIILPLHTSNLQPSLIMLSTSNIWNSKPSSEAQPQTAAPKQGRTNVLALLAWGLAIPFGILQIHEDFEHGHGEYYGKQAGKFRSVKNE
jgi:hypothetical protein